MQRRNRWNRWRRINGSIASLTIGLSIATGLGRSAIAAELTGWQFDPATQQLQVTVPAGTTPRYFLLAQPARIVLDLPNTQVGNVSAQQTFGGAVRQIRVGQFDATSTRIVIELSPDAELAPGQVELQQASTTGGTQWILRPLLTSGTADSAIAASPPAADLSIATPPQAAAPSPATIPPVAQPPAPSIAPLPAPVPAETAIAPPPAPAALPTLPPAESSIAPAAPLPPLEPNAIEIPVAPAAPPDAPASLPPLEPNAVEIPVTPAMPAAPPAASLPAAIPFQAEATAIDPMETTVLPSDSATSTVALNAPPAPSAALPALPAEPILPAREPVLLPPAPDSLPQPPRVEVPSIAPPATAAPTAPPLQAAAPSAIELPPALSAPASGSRVSVPPLNPIDPTAPTASPATSPSQPIEFGQPPAVDAPPAVSARRSSVLLPAGTVLSLRYPRETAIELGSGQSRQEVLVLQAAVRSPEGEVVLPAGTQVIGRFEVGRSGSRFVAQALSIEGRNIRLTGEAASGRDRTISDNDLLVHSAVGALALTLLGGFSGLGIIGGAAAGAATTYLSTPEPIVIQPNQVFEVRLVEDLLR